jgi:hypothetical protein
VSLHSPVAAVKSTRLPTVLGHPRRHPPHAAPSGRSLKQVALFGSRADTESAYLRGPDPAGDEEEDDNDYGELPPQAAQERPRAAAPPMPSPPQSTPDTSAAAAQHVTPKGPASRMAPQPTAPAPQGLVLHLLLLWSPWWALADASRCSTVEADSRATRKVAVVNVQMESEEEDADEGERF